jgi:hypothetical protein
MAEIKYMYGLNDPPLMSLWSDLAQQNEERIKVGAARHISRIEEILNIQYRIACHHANIWWLNPAAPMRRYRHLLPLLFSTFHKNLFVFFAVIDLTLKGLYGPARSLCRHIFESLVISKFCSISKSDRILKKWVDDEPIYFTNGILNKITKPDPGPLKEFWQFLCEYAHPTQSSQQITLELVDEVIEATEYNFILLFMLLECNYHLLNTHLIDGVMEHQARFYSQGLVGSYDVPKLRSRSRELFKESRKYLKSPGVSLVYTYRRKWVLKG